MFHRDMRARVYVVCSWLCSSILLPAGLSVDKNLESFQIVCLLTFELSLLARMWYQCVGITTVCNESKLSFSLICNVSTSCNRNEEN